MTPKFRARRAASAANMGLDEQPVRNLDWIGENKTHSLEKGNREVDRDHAPTSEKKDGYPILDVYSPRDKCGAWTYILTRRGYA
jgi:hypothetical protein